MTAIEILESVAGSDYSYSKGQIVIDAPEEREKDLLRAGYARPLEGKNPADERRTAIDETAKKRVKR